MLTRNPRDRNEKPQIERFRKAEREFGCEDDIKAFCDEVVWVAKHKLKDRPSHPDRE
jgi:hypothetical protein